MNKLQIDVEVNKKTNKFQIAVASFVEGDLTLLINGKEYYWTEVSSTHADDLIRRLRMGCNKGWLLQNLQRKYGKGSRKPPIPIREVLQKIIGGVK